MKMESPRQFLGRGFVEKWQGPGFFFLRMMGAFFWDPKISKADATKWINMDEYGSIWINRRLQLVFQINQKQMLTACHKMACSASPYMLPRSWILAKLFLASLKRIQRRWWHGLGGMDVKPKKQLPRFCRLVVFVFPVEQTTGIWKPTNYW